MRRRPARAPRAGAIGADGALFATFNRQGGPRGETEFTSQNWAMVTAAHAFGRGKLTFSGMFSAEPLTVGNPGYSEIFQEGEAYRGLQVTDHQHPHDLFMQLAATWRIPLGARAGFTVSGGPVGEAALGPVAFMHRPSSAENPTAPLSHHIFDSTHVSAGVVLAGLDRGPFAVEGSIFRGWSRTSIAPISTPAPSTPGRCVSGSSRIEWTIQGSHGYLHEPGARPGDQRRTNVSASWFRQRASVHGRHRSRRWNTRRSRCSSRPPTSGVRTPSAAAEPDGRNEIPLFPHRAPAARGRLVSPLKAVTGMVRRRDRARIQDGCR